MIDEEVMGCANILLLWMRPKTLKLLSWQPLDKSSPTCFFVLRRCTIVASKPGIIPALHPECSVLPFLEDARTGQVEWVNQKLKL